MEPCHDAKSIPNSEIRSPDTFGIRQKADPALSSLTSKQDKAAFSEQFTIEMNSESL